MMDPEDHERLEDLKAERRLVFTSAEVIVEKYQHRDRMPRRVEARFREAIQTLRAIDAEIRWIVDKWPKEKAEAPRVAPQWQNVAPAVELIRRRTALDPGSQANADRMAALIRDRFDGLGLDVEDPETLYVALVASGLFVEFTRSGLDNGETSDEVLHVVALVSQTFAAALIPYLPPEARS